MVAASVAAMMFCGATVVDLGSLYSHKSQLQNAADAAALAGAHAFADNNETIDEHPEADDVADTYVERNLGEGSHASRSFKARSKNDAIYYRVVLEDDAPTYFYRYFFNDSPRISVESVATIDPSSSTGSESNSKSGNDLFIFKKELRLVNTIENPDNFDKNNQIKTTFDGTVAFTDGSGTNADNSSNYKYDKIEYSTQSDKLKNFFTSKARDEGLSVNGALAKNSAEYAHECVFENYDMNGLAAITKEKVSKDNHSPVLAGNENNSQFYSKDLSQSKSITNAPSDKGGKRSADFFIDDTINGDTNDPVFIYLDPSLDDIIHVYVRSDNNRPVVFCYTGTGKFYVEYDKPHTFSGIFYAPNSSHFHINSRDGVFEGSIIANSMDIEGGAGTYRHKDFGIQGNGNGSGSSPKTSTVTANIHLSQPPDDIDWDD